MRASNESIDPIPRRANKRYFSFLPLLYLTDIDSRTGLDSFNAFNVVDSLVSLARDYKRTVVFTIHQPRSNIVALFDQLVVLAMGKLVYSGELDKCQGYFEGIGRPCPPGFNIADFLSAFITLLPDKTREKLMHGIGS
jgi:ABC-type multidrug transport system ATPase subunit